MQFKKALLQNCKFLQIAVSFDSKKNPVISFKLMDKTQWIKRGKDMRVQNISSALYSANKIQKNNAATKPSFQAKIYTESGYDPIALEKLGQESGRPYQIESWGYEKSYGQVYALYIEEPKKDETINSHSKEFLEKIGKKSGKPYHIQTMYMLHFDD